ELAVGREQVVVGDRVLGERRRRCRGIRTRWGGAAAQRRKRDHDSSETDLHGVSAPHRRRRPQGTFPATCSSTARFTRHGSPGTVVTTAAMPWVSWTAL